uniref:Secreted protein n=1 Tax=Heterorhabditis bacteriophora TaxID=37862 RepID=A0A1I7WZY6_HETBA
MWSVVLTIVLCTVLLEGKLYQPGYGYIGPVCAVVDGILFLHGVAKRNLDFVEVELFRAYQRDLSSFKNGPEPTVTLMNASGILLDHKL